MNTIEEITAELKDAAPGTWFTIKGYTPEGDAEPRDLSLSLIGPGAYKEMLQHDVEILQKANIDSDIGDCSASDLETARMQMIEAKQKSLQGMEEGKEPTRQGPAYERLGEGSLHTHPDHPGCLYILRLKSLGDLPDPKPAKGSVPRAKQLLAKKLLLPSRRYIHAVKLEPGKFKWVTLI